MPISHFRLIWRHFGGTPALQLAILDGTGVTDAMLHGAKTTVTIRQQLRQLENMNRNFEPDWFLDVPEQLHFSAHGAISIATISAPTLADAIAVLCDFVHVRMPLHRVHLRRQTDRCALEIAVSDVVDFELWRPVLFINMIATKSLIATIIARKTAAAEFEFVGPRPPYADRLEAALDGPALFDAAANCVIFPTAWLAAESAFADHGLYTSAIAKLNELADTREHMPRGLRHQVEQMLAEHTRDRPDASACAKKLGLSRRTLTRRLEEEGTCFRHLLDCDLRNRALEMIDAGILSKARIADNLGYRNQTSFDRAMKRWTSQQMAHSYSE